MNIPQLLGSIITTFFVGIANYLPQFIAGLLILLVGMLIAELLKQAIMSFSDLVKLEKWAKDTKLVSAHDLKVWPRLLGEFVRWTVLILFLVGAVEVWGITKVSEVLNQLLLYLPNVLVAVVIGLVGMVIGNLVSEVVQHGTKGMGYSSSGGLATMARYAIFVFTALIVLHQLGVAQDLIRILFTGIVAMISIAGGLAFGLGGQDTARDVLKGLRSRLEK